MSGFNLRRSSSTGLWQPCAVVNTDAGAYSSEGGAADAARRLNRQGDLLRGVIVIENGRVYLSASLTLDLMIQIANHGGTIAHGADGDRGFFCAIRLPQAIGQCQYQISHSREYDEPHEPTLREAIDRALLAFVADTGAR